jgi:hypothetical protein
MEPKQITKRERENLRVWLTVIKATEDAALEGCEDGDKETKIMSLAAEGSIRIKAALREGTLDSYAAYANGFAEQLRTLLPKMFTARSIAKIHPTEDGGVEMYKTKGAKKKVVAILTNIVQRMPDA